MNIPHNLAETWAAIKKKTAEIFQPTELAKLASKNKFIQRSTSLLQAKDFVDVMTATSVDPKAVSLEGLCSALRELNPEADLTKQSLMKRINQPEASSFLKDIFK